MTILNLETLLPPRMSKQTCERTGDNSKIRCFILNIIMYINYELARCPLSFSLLTSSITVLNSALEGKDYQHG
jgi:hypothetical protein